MRKMKIWAVAMIALVAATSVKAQEFTVTADLVSSYVWRGVQYSGASVQPGVKFTKGGFTVGTWGSTGLKESGAGLALYNEMDMYTSYATDFGLTVGLTDYYFPGTDFSDLSTATGAHCFEVNLGYTLGKFSLAANYMLNEAGGAGTKGGDMYYELGYAFKSVSLFAGAGSGWHTPDAKLGVVNVGLKTSKTIKFTDSFSLPVSGSLILNPTTNQFYIVAGVSL